MEDIKSKFADFEKTSSFEVKSCSKKFSYNFPVFIRSNTNDFKINCKSIRDKELLRVHSSEEVFKRILTQDYPTFDYIQQAPYLLCAKKSNIEFYQSKWELIPDECKYKEQRRLQQSCYLDFVFYTKLVILEPGNSKLHKDVDPVKFDTIKKDCPLLTIIPIYDIKTNLDSYKKAKKIIEEIHKLPDQDPNIFFEYFDQSDFIDYYNTIIDCAKNYNECILLKKSIMNLKNKSTDEKRIKEYEKRINSINEIIEEYKPLIF